MSAVEANGRHSHDIFSPPRKFSMDGGGRASIRGGGWSAMQGSRMRLFLGVSLLTIFVLLVIVCILLGVIFRSPSSDDAKQTNGSGQFLNATTSSSPSPPEKKRPRDVDLRLPFSLSPRHYDLTLQAFLGDPEHLRFFGSVNITVAVLSPTSTIRLHANELTIESVGVAVNDSGRLSPVRVREHSLDTLRQFLVIDTARELKAGSSIVVRVSFSGRLGMDLRGFYVVRYADAKGIPRFVASTQFQPTFARRAFPCFDEPSLKATFTVTLIRPVNYVSLSNMDVAQVLQLDSPSWMADVYEPTPPMSTYLLAFTVCDFPMRRLTTASGVNVKVWARSDVIKDARYAMRVAARALDFFADFFHTPYPLKKLDMLAMPEFMGGAMENWGLAVFHEYTMLCDETSSDIFTAYRVRRTVGHEVAHHWFGDLVTPSWWDDLWLNEGFASYVSQLSAYEMEPLGNVDDMIIAREMAPALITDSLRASHPISAVVKDPEQIGEIFDDISYSKGASLIRMMQEILGETVFREGLKTFLRRHSYSHATTNDLWRALAEASAEAGISIDLTSIMKTWTAQMGYPLVRLTCDGSSGTVTASQERFLLLREEGAAGRRGGGGDQAEYRWEVPLTVTAFMDSGRNESRLLWLHEERERYEIAEFRDLGWCLGNFKMRGFFRMAYDEGNWEKIIHQMLTNHEVIDVISRTQLFNDAFWVARGDALSTVIPLRLSRYLAKETEVLPWWLALDSLKDMRGLMAWSRGYPDFLRYGVQLLSPLYDSLGWEPSEAQNALQRYLRALILGGACAFGHKHCVREARRLYGLAMDNATQPISDDFKSFVYCTAIADGGDDEWQFAWRKYVISRDITERLSLIGSMACSTKPHILQSFMETALHGNVISPMETERVISSVAHNPVGRTFALPFMINHWEKLKLRFAGNFFVVRRLINGVMSHLSTSHELRQVEDFVSGLGDLGAGELAWRQAIEKTEANVRWLEANDDTIATWLQANTAV